MKLAKIAIALCLCALAAAALPCYAADPPLTITIKRLTLESALKIARAAVAECRKKGYQIAATVVDRGGNTQVVLRDVLAPGLTLTVSYRKAFSAMSFNAATSAMENRFKTPFSVGKVEQLVLSAGGLPINIGGILYGGIGISGAPGGDIDEACAQAGIDAIAEDLEMAD
ncbi:MAG: heme-binding protein [Gammaproteobacteria bacterium]|nr:heme-binding protein [Gammaproteobacteria bacterium]